MLVLMGREKLKQRLKYEQKVTEGDIQSTQSEPKLSNSFPQSTQ